MVCYGSNTKVQDYCSICIIVFTYVHLQKKLNILDIVPRYWHVFWALDRVRGKLLPWFTLKERIKYQYIFSYIVYLKVKVPSYDLLL